MFSLAISIVIALALVYVLPKCVHIDITIKPVEPVIPAPMQTIDPNLYNDMPDADDLVRAIHDLLEVDTNER